jgi:hypothetical protein
MCFQKVKLSVSPVEGLLVTLVELSENFGIDFGGSWWMLLQKSLQ